MRAGPIDEYDVNARDDLGQTELHRAAFRLDVGEVRRLLALGADTEIAADNGMTPIFAAARWCKAYDGGKDTDDFHRLDQVMIALVQAGADTTVVVSGKSLQDILSVDYLTQLEEFKPAFDDLNVEGMGYN